MQKLIGEFFDKCTRDRVSSLAASLAFYTALSLAPLLVLFLAISAALSPHLQDEFLLQARNLMGGEAERAIQMIMENASQHPKLGSIGSILGVATLLFSASLIFGELRSALDQIFTAKVEATANQSYFAMTWSFVRDRIFNVGLVLSFIFTLVVSLILSSLLSGLFSQLEGSILLMVFDVLISFVFFSLLFAMVYRYLPSKRLHWLPAFRSGVLTSVLFTIGKQAIGIYLGNSAFSSSYGSAGSVIVLLVWVYYSTLITLVGAEISAIFELRHRLITP